MARLIPLHEIAQTHNIDLAGTFDPTGSTVYASGDDKVGTVRGAMADPDTGRLRYLIVDVGGWFSSKQVLVPVGMARIEDDAVYLDNLTKAQVRDMSEYRAGQAYQEDVQLRDERVLRGQQDVQNAETDRDLTVMETRPEAAAPAQMAAPLPEQRFDYRDQDTSDTLFKTPERLQLLEERLIVNKHRFQAGSVEIAKHVENRQEQVNVNLAHEELVIERRPVNDPRPVEGNVQLGADAQTVRVDLEAERADVHKQAYVTEEVEVGKRTESETRTFSENVGREVLDVNKTGDVEVRGEGSTDLLDRNERER